MFFRKRHVAEVQVPKLWESLQKQRKFTKASTVRVREGAAVQVHSLPLQVEKEGKFEKAFNIEAHLYWVYVKRVLYVYLKLNTFLKFVIYCFTTAVSCTEFTLYPKCVVWSSILFLMSVEGGHQLMRHQCHKCGRSYSRFGDLNRHQRYECGVEPQFPCPYCPYRAKKKTTMQTHVVLKHQNKLSTNVKFYYPK
jgi:hypothetical protein